MKRFLTIVLCMTAVMVVSLSAKAQEITITLYPGWNWISYPKAEVLDINTALGDFVPVDGDRIKSQFTNSAYYNGYWRGGVTHFMPGWGYMYYSNRTEVVSFVFGEAASQLIVTTTTPTNITSVSANCGGNVTIGSEGNVSVTQRGICWSTSPNPTINDNYLEAGNGLGSFSVLLTALTSATTYNVRAFAVTETDTFYGDNASFTTLDTPTVPEGAINGLYTINAIGNQVYFSKGNLQYIGSATTPYWKFADDQWDYLGVLTGQNSSSQNVDRDLFGWGTSGWDCGNTYYMPYDTYSYYYNGTYWHGNLYGPPGLFNLTGRCANSDWGVYNAISNGGDEANLWRTLSIQEWQYIFNTRDTESGIRFVKAFVNGMNGVILLPDNWNTDFYALNNTNEVEAPYNSNTFALYEWNIIESYGAVFLPAAGWRTGSSLSYGGESGCYWSSTHGSTSTACSIYFENSSFNFDGDSYRGMGYSVRLVQDYNP